MTRRLRMLSAAMLLSALGLGLAACGPLISFGDEGRADETFSLRYAGNYVVENDSGPTVYIDEPHVGDGMQGQDISVRLESYGRSALAGARWTAPLPSLVRDYMTRAFGEGAGVRPIGEGGLDVRVDCRVASKIWSFDFVPGRTAGADNVDIAVEVMLVRLWDGKLVSQTTFTGARTVDGKRAKDIAVAYNAAMADVGARMTEWLVEHREACRSE